MELIFTNEVSIFLAYIVAGAVAQWENVGLMYHMTLVHIQVDALFTLFFSIHLSPHNGQHYIIEIVTKQQSLIHAYNLYGFEQL